MQGCVIHDLYRQRRQQHTERLAPAGLEKGGLFVLKKTVLFALIKAVWFVLKKTDCVALRKAVFSPLKRRFVALKKAYFFVLRTVGCVYRGAMLRLDHVGVTNVGHKIPNT